MCRLYCEKCGSMHHSTQHHNEAEAEEMETRVMTVLVCKEGAPSFAEGNYEVLIDSVCDGEFVTVRELTDKEQEIRIEREEWPELRSAIDRMMGGVRNEVS